MKYSILIMDDDPFAVDGIARVLQGHYDVTSVYNVAAMRQHLKQQRCDLVILDLQLGQDGSGIDYIRMIKDTGAKVLVLTAAVGLESLLICFRLQVNGYIRKWEEPETLLKKVQGALEGHLMINPKLLLEIIKPENKPPAFGRRELELVELAFAHPEASNAELADMMNLSDGRVKNLFQSIYKKIHINKRAELIPELRRRGYRPGMEEIEGGAMA